MITPEIAALRARILAEHPGSWEAASIRRRQIAEVVMGSETRSYDHDDLLRWLRAAGFDVEFGAPRTHHDAVMLAGERLTKVTLKPAGAHSSSYRAPTLLGALELAVRAAAHLDQPAATSSASSA